MKVVFTDLSVPKEICLQQISLAFADLAALDDRWRRWILSNVRHIIVWSGHVTSADRIGGFQIASSLAVNPSSLLIASVFVHEAVHVRLAKHRITAKRRRVEELCIKEQVRFLRSAGEAGAAMAPDFEEALNSPWWTDEAHESDMSRVAREHGLPRWLLTFISRDRAGR